MKPFGYSLHFDMYGVEATICDDLGYCHDTLVDLVEHLRMHQQSPPFIFRTPPELNPDMIGLSGWVPLIQSGISIHTLTKHGFVSFDIYTCGELNKTAVIQFLCERFRPTHFDDPQMLVRGPDYHRASRKVARIAESQSPTSRSVKPASVPATLADSPHSRDTVR